MPQEVISYCRGCVAHCGLVFEVDDNRIVSHRGDRKHVHSAGFKCIKGDMSVEIIQGMENRFEHCQKRDVSGQLKPIAAETLMDEVAAAIQKSIDTWGPRSVALYCGTAGYRKSFNFSFARQLMAAIGSPTVFSTMTIDQSAHWVVDGRLGVFLTGKRAFADLDAIILTGTNPVVSHGGPYQGVPIVNTAARIREYKQQGRKLIVVDPRKTETAKLADIHICPKPGFDAEIFASLIGIILDNGWQDQAFCDRFVQNLDALKAAVAPFTPEMVAARADIKADDLIAAAKALSPGKKVYAGFGTGMSMSPNPNTAGHLVEALNAILGGYLREGETVRNPGIFFKRGTAEGVYPASRSWEQEPKLSTGFGTLYGEFPSSQIADQILTPSPTQIKTLIVLGANPAMAFGEPARMREALGALECLVVIEPRPTETTELADYIVAPSLPLEIEDITALTTGWAEEPYMQYAPAVVAPPPGTLTEWRFFNGVANRLGHVLRVSPVGFGTDPKAVEQAQLITPEREWTTEQLLELSLQQIGLTLEELRRHPNGMKLNLPETSVSPTAQDDGARLDVCPTDVALELAGIVEAPNTAAGKYQLIVRRIVELMNSEFRESSTLSRRFGGAAPLYMHPDDMVEEGFSVGDMIVVDGENGSLSARVRPDPTLRRKTVSMPHCWSGDPENAPRTGHTSALVTMAIEKVQAIDGMPQQSALAVNLTQAGLVEF